MKLSEISESLLTQYVRNGTYFEGPIKANNQPYQASSGHDSASRASSDSSQPTGTTIPAMKPRIGKFFGQKPPGSITL